MSYSKHTIHNHLTFFNLKICLLPFPLLETFFSAAGADLYLVFLSRADLLWISCLLCYIILRKIIKTVKKKSQENNFTKIEGCTLLKYFENLRAKMSKTSAGPPKRWRCLPERKEHAGTGTSLVWGYHTAKIPNLQPLHPRSLPCISQQNSNVFILNDLTID